jgi:hypothetical protein
LSNDRLDSSGVGDYRVLAVCASIVRAQFKVGRVVPVCASIVLGSGAVQGRARIQSAGVVPVALRVHTTGCLCGAGSGAVQGRARICWRGSSGVARPYYRPHAAPSALVGRLKNHLR